VVITLFDMMQENTRLKCV